MKYVDLIPIDLYAHAEVSCRQRAYPVCRCKPDVHAMILKQNAMRVLNRV